MTMLKWTVSAKSNDRNVFRNNNYIIFLNSHFYNF